MRQRCKTLVSVTHSELSKALLHLGGGRNSDLRQSTPHKARVDLRLVGGSGSTFDLTLEASIRDEFDCKLKHEAVWVLFSKLVEKVTPCSILDHFLKPRRGLRREKEREREGGGEGREAASKAERGEVRVPILPL